MKYWIDSRPAGTAWSGDFVECVQLDAQRHAIVVGDVAGHGETAGHAAAILGAFMRRMLVEGRPLTNALRTASASFKETLQTDVTPFVSVFVSVADLRTAMLTYASAGHEPALLFHADGMHEHLGPTGPVLGIAAEPVFAERRLRLTHESLLVVVTDGITEARRLEDDEVVFFGSSGVVRAVRDAARAGRNPAQAISNSALEHARGALADDASVFVSSLTPMLALSL